ncbi:D-alanyl-D-alanine carboxypeptidase/D-alanyl-D-alanine endopeptidase [Noviherbaspirillum massiliense]|uniref:D-alanyl-D-alanine carboxypeptidase/D-alanyl-D-alanine endopeptidase n=1 Tax=Noviherbaspirillum massiliense TaxID=1465823 RepID=UPI00037C712C
MAEMNQDIPLAPASTMKLVTTSAALELLGPTYTWKTRAYVDGIQQGDVLRGNLVIKGSGDPAFMVEHLWQLLRRIRARGIREIKGDLVLDRSVFEQAVFDPAGFDGDPAKPYNVGADALLLNYKVLGFRFLPDAAEGRVTVATDPPLAGYPILAPSMTNDECGDWRGRLQPVIDASGARFGGSYSALCGERTLYLHPYQISQTQYFAMVFRQIWKELGGCLKGEVVDGIVPPDARMVAEWESAPLPQVIRDINKFSNNVMARQLLLTIGAEALQLPATPDRGAAIVHMWLANKKGIDTSRLVMDNGVGLSRVERIPALTMARLLANVYRSPLMPEFLSSMPLIGLDGTMRQRLRNQPVTGRGHIKTGMLNDARAIAGYVLAASGKSYVVVCMINHANASRSQEALDVLLQWIFEKG